jgi:hypothetical protein
LVTSHSGSHLVSAPLVGHRPQHLREDVLANLFQPGVLVRPIALALPSDPTDGLSCPVDLDEPVQLLRADTDDDVGIRLEHGAQSIPSRVRPPAVGLRLKTQELDGTASLLLAESDVELGHEEAVTYVRSARRPGRPGGATVTPGEEALADESE